MAESKVPGVMAFDMDVRAEEKPDFAVLTFENWPYPEEVLTYGDLVLRGRKLARALEKQGIGRGDIFSVVMRNHPELVVSMYAATALGAVMVAIDPRSKGGKLIHQISNSNSKGVIFAAEFMEAVEAVLHEIPDVKSLGAVYRDDFGVPVSAKHPNLNEILAGPEVQGFTPDVHRMGDPFMIIYTSGTTGDPKGVRQRQNRLLAYAGLGRMMWQYKPEDCLYTGLSLTHSHAQGVTLIPALYLGVPAVVSRRFTKSRIWDICRAYRCTSFGLLGGMMMGIYSEPQRPDDGDNPVQVVVSAGTPRPIWEAFEGRFNVRIHEFYGATEGTFVHKPPGEGPVGSFGRSLEGPIEVRVVREDDSECELGETGELLWRTAASTPQVEYHGDKAASEAKTRGGWVRTGDMVHRDAEGWLFFDHRRGGGLRRQGDFILPAYVEAAIVKHPDVSDVCVYGIPASSGAPGESDLVAAVVPVAGRPPDIKGIFDRCLADLERNSVPSHIQVVEEIPKTASQKNLDRVLREEFDSASPNVYRFEDFT